MRRGGKIISCGLVALCFVFAAALVGIAADKGPDTIKPTASIWPNPTKTNVEFTHKKHVEDYKIACTQCHHVYKDGQNTWKEGDPVQKCDACHTEATVEGEKKLTPEQQKLNLKLAFHNNCIPCHQKEKKDKPDTKAPVTCAQCHPAKQ